LINIDRADLEILRVKEEKQKVSAISPYLSPTIDLPTNPQDTLEVP
jgi:hypothetical protein